MNAIKNLRILRSGKFQQGVVTTASRMVVAAAKKNVASKISYKLKMRNYPWTTHKPMEYAARTITDRGHLLNSISAQTVSTKMAIIKVTEPYAVYVHQGSKGHYVPFEKLEGWVKRKIQPDQKDIKKVTLAIQRKIRKKGTNAKPFLALAFKQTLIPKTIKKIMITEMKKGLV